MQLLWLQFGCNRFDFLIGFSAVCSESGLNCSLVYNFEQLNAFGGSLLLIAIVVVKLYFNLLKPLIKLLKLLKEATTEPRHCSSVWKPAVLCFWLWYLIINSRTAIAEAIIGLLLVFLLRQNFCSNSGRHNHNHFKSAFCSFVHVISTEVRAWRHFSLLVERVFLFIPAILFWSHLTYLTLKNDFLFL